MRKLSLTDLSRSPIVLLMICGFLFAVRIMISKVSLNAGALPLQVAFIANAGAAIFLYAIVKKQNISIPKERRHLTLYVVLGAISVCLPNALQQFVVLHVGPAYTSTVFSLSPVITLSIAAGIGLERLVLRRVIGIGAGLLGMLTLIQQQIYQTNFDAYFWILIGLGIPVCAAVGNIIRTVYWPAGASALAFACATVGTSAVFLLALTLAFEEQEIYTLLALNVVGPLVLLIIFSAVSYLMNFRLQEIGGSVFFSQLGYWGTGFGVVLAALLFGDVLNFSSILALGAIVGGGVLVRRTPEPAPAPLPCPTGR